MLARNLFISFLLLNSFSCFATDIDMRHLQQLLKASEQQAIADMQQDTSVKHKTIPTPHIDQPKRVLIDVRSNHSDGAHSMSLLIGLAKKRGIDAMAFTEHDRYSIRFGIEPIPSLLGYAMQHPSLYVSGLDKFFSELSQQRSTHPNIQLFAGTESTPGYTWSGIPFINLSLHQAEQHFITLGIETAEQVKALSSYDLRHAYGHRTVSLFFWGTLIFILFIRLIRHRKPLLGILLFLSCIAFLASWFIKPTTNAASDFIQTSHAQDLFVIWAHPGTLSGIRKGPMGIQLDTPPYNTRVFQEPTADAFAAVYGDTDQNTQAGGLWDRYMMDYMRGYHDKPIWAVAAGDYHAEGMANEYLGNFPMDVWSSSAKPNAILSAMRQGHMAAWGMTKEKNIALKALYLEDANGLRLLPGDEAHVQPPLHLVAALTSTVKSNLAHTSFQGEWIVDGHIVKRSLLTVNSEEVDIMTLPMQQGDHVIRLQIKQGLRMVANPFLVHIK